MNTKRVYYVGLIISLSILLVSVFYDLQVSNLLYNRHNSFANFMADYGELPLYFLVFIMLMFLLVQAIKVKKYVIAFLLIVFTIIINILIFSPIFLLVLAINCCLFILFWSIKFNQMLVNKLILLAILIIVFTTSMSLVIQIIKVFWGRVRYRNLADNFSIFLIPQGINGNYSFPSGHMGSAVSFLALCFAFYIFKIKSRVKVIAVSVIVSWIILMGLARIIAGAHYLSDVTFSLFLAINLYYLIYCRWQKLLKSA